MNKMYLEGEHHDKVMLIKDRYSNSEEKSIKTHLTCGPGGITGFYTPKELIKYYGNCESVIIYYEKDYGNDMPVIRSFLLIETDVDYNKKIMEERNEKNN